MSAEYDAELGRIARTLSEIARTLESADRADERVQRTLELTRVLIPYRRCALLKAFSGTSYTLVVVPEPPASERGALLSTLTRLFRLIAHADEIGRSSDAHPHLTLPLMGLDEVIGLVRMEPSEDISYDVQHLRLLSVITAQLGAYLTMIKLRDEDAQRTRELAAAHDFQQILVGVVSHDLRNPLSVITTVASHLLRKTEDPQRAKAIERALRSAERANLIINDLLDVTHARVTSHLPVSRQRIDLLALLKEALDDLGLSHPGREIQLVATEVVVLGDWDPGRLTQVATNLITNALQYGAERAPVRVTLRAEADEVVFAVHNRGPVIPDDLVPVLFNPFRQGQHAQRRVAGGGLGLGLYIVEQIVRSHGGTVSVRSSEAEGTTFTVVLPRSMTSQRASEDAPARSASHGQELASMERGNAGSTTVMVVEDEDEVRLGISEILEGRDYKVVPASNGQVALELLRQGLRPGLILLDIRMPVMDGETFYNACREDPALSSIPLLILSADAATAVKLTRGGASGFLAKPVQPETLLRAIETFSQ
ncbi:MULTISPECIES: ATP-binding protein [Myxococcus]|uniref:histidine kinase n=1 Tax=Myxococcus llanfairpwllgwyngyllgogerychwyrndrobwllllantysiliogogogochensis TaxID=2590453 RepID=A0A540XA57_9BACT|nr:MULTISPECIES: ATP-binding protein [Myxococcus]NTX04500.1 response regulator [Myxococcus sp. CA040A]NTX17068.1 response regulator [Myxococcus sp. CA056]TQF18018.1 response regulator [Myxococcus llanfairpwllgwyngyllgogerychwyrndrobwllllantysiliogogogochensis]